jgi:hypothetical protein
MQQDKTEKKIDRDNRFGKPLEWALALAAGLTSGTTTFVNLVRTKYHDDSLAKNEITGLYSTNKADLKELTSSRIRKARGMFREAFPGERAFEEPTTRVKAETVAAEMAEAAKSGSGKITSGIRKFLATSRDKLNDIVGSSAFKNDTREYIKGTHETKRAFDRFLDEYTETHLGIASRGLKGHTLGSIQRFETFGPYSQRNIAFKTLFAVGAGTAVTLMAFNQLNTRDKLNEIDKTTGNNGRRLDALLTAQEAADGRVIEVQGLLQEKKAHGEKSKAVLAEREHHATAEQAR